MDRSVRPRAEGDGGLRVSGTGRVEQAPVRDLAPVLALMRDGRCLAMALTHRRPLAVSVLAMEPDGAAALRLAVQLAGGGRAHGWALEAGSLTLNLLDAGRLHLHRRYGGVGPGAGWDEVLGLPVHHRGSRPPVLDVAATWLEVTPQPRSDDPSETPEWLLATVVDGHGPFGAALPAAPALVDRQVGVGERPSPTRVASSILRSPGPGPLASATATTGAGRCTGPPPGPRGS